MQNTPRGCNQGGVWIKPLDGAPTTEPVSRMGQAGEPFPNGNLSLADRLFNPVVPKNNAMRRCAAIQIYQGDYPLDAIIETFVNKNDYYTKSNRSGNHK